jgi:hypothetical protein
VHPETWIGQSDGFDEYLTSTACNFLEPSLNIRAIAQHKSHRSTSEPSLNLRAIAQHQSHRSKSEPSLNRKAIAQHPRNSEIHGGAPGTPSSIL